MVRVRITLQELEFLCSTMMLFMSQKHYITYDYGEQLQEKTEHIKPVFLFTNYPKNDLCVLSLVTFSLLSRPLVM